MDGELATPMKLISKRVILQIFLTAGLLIAARLAFDIASAAAYAHPESDFGQSIVALIFFGLSLLFAFFLAIVRFLQRRLFEGAALMVVLCAPFSFPDFIDRHYWKFQIHKPEYELIIQSDPSPTPKYQVFSWGNRNISLGAGVVFEAIVYDESDDIARNPGSRSPEWRGNTARALPQDNWITAKSPDCRGRIKSLGDHFYYVSQEC
jgi:hypothetical protein